MENLKILSQKELERRAKILYFDKMPSVDVIYVDEYGRFDITGKENLIEQNRVLNRKVFEIKRSALTKQGGEEKK